MKDLCFLQLWQTIIGSRLQEMLFLFLCSQQKWMVMRKILGRFVMTLRVFPRYRIAHGVTEWILTFRREVETLSTEKTTDKLSKTFPKLFPTTLSKKNSEYRNDVEKRLERRVTVKRNRR